MVIGQIALHVMRKYYAITKIVFFLQRANATL